MDKLKNKFPILILWMAICSTLFFNAPHLNQYPTHIHAWSQFDHYAISLGFVENNLDFFHPQTNTKLVSPWDSPEAKQDFSYITSVDFPIHHYIPAISMKITGNTSPIHNRLYQYIYSLIGVLFLYKLSKLLIENEYLAIIPSLFLVFSPVFNYYQVGIMPSIPSLANFIIGTYVYVKYTQSNVRKHWLIALIFITLAFLSRTSFLFVFLSILFFEFIRLLRAKKHLGHFFLTAIAAVAMIGIYYVYNYYLRTTYGTIFLNNLLYPKDYNQFKTVLSKVLDNWKFNYFTEFQFIIMLFMVVLVFIFRRKFLNWNLLALAGLFILSALSFFVLMELQYPDHNYYFLDSFTFPILFLIIALLSAVKSFRWLSLATFILIVPLFVKSVKSVKQSLEDAYRSEFWDVNHPTYEAFKGSKKLLDNNGVPADATILSYNAYIPCLPFYFMDRKGIPIILDDEFYVRDAPTWGYDYMVYQNQYFLDRTVPKYPEIMDHFEIIATDGKITLCKKKRTSN